MRDGRGGPVVNQDGLPHYMLDGHVVGYPSSDADLVLGQYGVYGQIEIGESFYNLNPRKAGPGSYIQKVNASLASSPPAATPQNPVPAPSPVTPSGALSNPSDLVMDMEPSFTDPIGDETSRVKDAFNRYEDLFLNSDADVNLELEGVYYVTSGEITNGGTGTQIDGDMALEDYEAWLANNLISGVHAYQLWTGSDLESNDRHVCSFGSENYCAYGIGNINTVDNNLDNESSSVLEGLDNNCCDGYDGSNGKDRGIVSGHENGHVYGQENHPDTNCDTVGGACTLMDSDGKDISDQHFDFVQASEDEIHQEFYNDAEP